MNELKLRDVCRILNIRLLGRPYKGWITASCPFASWTHARGTDRNPGFAVKINPTGYSAFHCFSCGAKGSIPELIHRLEGRRQERYFADDGTTPLEMRVALDETSLEPEPWEREISHQEEAPTPLNKAMFSGMYPLAWEVPEAREYLIGRGVQERSSYLMELQYDPDQYRIIAPVYDRERNLYGFNGRTILPEHLWPPALPGRKPYKKTKDYEGLSKAKNIMGIQLADNKKPLYLVEGLFAQLHLYDIGADEWVIPVNSLGSHLSLYQRDILVRNGPSIYVGYDNDSAGEQGIYGSYDEEGKPDGKGAASLLSPHMPTFIPLYPRGVDDPDNLTREQIHQMIMTDFDIG